MTYPKRRELPLIIGTMVIIIACEVPVFFIGREFGHAEGYREGFREAAQTRDVRWFGAVGDGITDDSAAISE